MKSTAVSREYKGKDVYVGIDVHKRTYTVVARVDGEEVKRWTTLAEPEKLAKQLNKYFKGGVIHSAYEAGFSGFGLHRELKSEGIKSQVVHAASIEVASNNRVKTDKRDAAKIAKQLESGSLRSIRVPKEEEESRRLLSRTRSQLVSARTQCQNRIRMKAHQFGLIGAEDRRQMSHQFVEELLSNSPSEEFRIAVLAHQQVWRTLDQAIKNLEAKLREQAEQDRNEKTYRSVPGVGKLSARVLSNELGNLLQFDNERQLFSYTGLTPGEYSSGEHTRRGSITKQGNRHLRGILIEIAWRAVKKDKSLAEFFQRVSSRRSKKRAIVAVARKLVGRIRATFRQGVLYEYEPIAK